MFVWFGKIFTRIIRFVRSKLSPRMTKGVVTKKMLKLGGDCYEVTIFGTFRGKEMKETYPVSRKNFDKIQIGSEIDITDFLK